MDINIMHVKHADSYPWTPAPTEIIKGNCKKKILLADDFFFSPSPNSPYLAVPHVMTCGIDSHPCICI